MGVILAAPDHRVVSAIGEPPPSTTHVEGGASEAAQGLMAGGESQRRLSP